MNRYRFDDDFSFKECLAVIGWVCVLVFFTATLALLTSI